MRELVIISGKGGTGKTSITASFAVLAGKSVLADCDVDAADLHLVLPPRVLARHEFMSGHEAVLRPDVCDGCSECVPVCRFGAISAQTDAAGGSRVAIDAAGCEGCGVCVEVCPAGAIDFPARRCGEWMESETASGPMVHARLGIAAENSGKLVSTVRQQARRIAEEQGLALILVDGPPGIGCPVIASITGASQVLVVTEPTLSGEHDLERVLALTRHFGISTAVCVNKWDINPAQTERIEARAREAGATIAGRVRYDPAVTRAQIQQRAVVEIDCACAADIRQVWQALAMQ